MEQDSGRSHRGIYIVFYFKINFKIFWFVSVIPIVWN